MSNPLSYAHPDRAPLRAGMCAYERFQRRTLYIVTALCVLASALAWPTVAGLIGILLGSVSVVLLLICLPAAMRVYGNPRGWIHAAKSLACFLLIALTVKFDLPLRFTFALSSPWLNAAADRIEKGQPLSTPTMIGPFLIRGYDVRRGCVCLWTDPSLGGPHGFVRHPRGMRYTFNVWSDTDLTSRWQYTEED